MNTACSDRALEAHRQKARVLLGDETVRRAEAAAGGNDKLTLAALQRALEAVDPDAIPFMQLFNLWPHLENVAALLRSPEIAGTAAQLLGATPTQRVRLYQDSVFLKQPGHGATHWHSDLCMAPLDTNDLVTCWLPLQPVAAVKDGGSGLIFASGSHRDVGLHYWHPTGHDASSRGYAEGSGGALAPGDATWHHGWLLHAAAPNDADAPRLALAASFFLDGARRFKSSKAQRALAAEHDEDAESYAPWLKEVKPGACARHARLPVVWPQKASGTDPRSLERALRPGAHRRPGRLGESHPW